MFRSSRLTSTLGAFVRRWIGLPAVIASTTVFLCGCDALNPAFVNLFPDSNAASTITLPNAPGHVVVALSNQTRLDEHLLEYYLTLPGVNLSEAEVGALIPRVRLQVRITFVDGTFQVIEFIDGSTTLVEPAFSGEADPDLNQNDLNNAVAVCDVALVEVEPGSDIEVFIPVQMIGYELVESTTPGGGPVNEFEPRSSIIPQFWELQVDDVDEDGNTTLQRNIGVRNVPSPVPNVICGSVVIITMTGTLSVPFEIMPNQPSFDQDDEATVAQIGGRYQFNVSVQ